MPKLPENRNLISEAELAALSGGFKYTPPNQPEPVSGPAAVAASPMPVAPGGGGSQPGSIAEELQYEQLLELRKIRGEREEIERQARAARESNCNQVAQNIAMRAFEQAECPHRKPNSQPAIAGQRDHQNDYHWICLYCQREWTNGELPQALRISQDRVGGPQWG